MARILRWCWVAMGLLAGPAAADRVFEGELGDGLGRFRIEVPEGWQPGGRLIVYNHGFSFSDPRARSPATAPDAATGERLRAAGYALAAGSYPGRGWSLFRIVPAQRALLQAFRERVGAPGQVIQFGGSLGGLVSLLSAEAMAAEGQPAAGVLAACPPLGGARTWDQAVDVRLLFDAVCPDSPLPASSDPALPWILDANQIPASLTSLDDPDALLAMGSAANRVRQCTGLFQPAVFDTAAQRQRRNQLKSLLGLSEDRFLKTQLGYALFGLSDLVRDPGKLGGHSAFDNRGVVYGDPLVDARVLRVERDPLAAVRLAAVSNPSGDWGEAHVLVVHTDRDELVFPEHLSVLAEVARPEARAPVLTVVREPSPGHCAFTAAELGAALEALQDWIDGGPAPSPAALDARCEAQASAADCRFAPGYTPAPLASRIRPRPRTLDRVDADHTGAWFDPAYDGEGWVVEVLGNGVDAVVTWYTYPDPDQPGSQRWIAGRGRIAEDGIHVAEAFETRGGRFGDFDPASVAYLPFGEFTLAFTFTHDGLPGPGSGRLRYLRRDGRSGERNLQQIASHARPPQHRPEAPPERPPPHPDSRFGGSWYRGPEAPGEGLQFLVDAEGRGTLVWYTYDPEGHPAWLLGPSTAAAAPGLWRLALLRPQGARFGDAFDPAAVQTPPWGEAELHFSGCDTAELRWTTSEPGWPPAGRIALRRLTVPAGSAACTEPDRG